MDFIEWDKYSLIDYYHNKKNEVVLKLKEKDKIIYKKVICKNYFFIKKEDYEKTKKVLNNFIVINEKTNLSENIEFSFKEEKEYIKVLYNPNTYTWLKYVIKDIVEKLEANDIKTFEADLYPGDNFILSENVNISKDYNILYFDIETKDTQGGIEIGRDRILSICAIDDKGNKFVLCDDNEKVILNKFNDLISKYDIITGWNSKRFDYPYIIERMKYNGIYFNRNAIIHIDLMKVFMDSFAVKTRIGHKYISSFSLDNVAKNFIDDSKLDIKEGGEGYGGRLWNLFKKDRQKLIDYNMQDSVLLKKLDDEFHLLRNEIEVANFVKAPLSKTRSLSSMIDFLLIREARNNNMHFKTTKDIKEKPKQSGGIVLEPKPGLYKNVNIYDFGCLTGDTKVKTSVGFKFIKDIQRGDNICGLLNNVIVNAVKSKISKDVYKITLKSGKIIKATAEHKFMSKNDKIKILEVKDLKIGDNLFVK